uniref:Sterile alpha motif domain containing 11 n=1 Tax=Macaca fascicularis TaxID=9541 RepID=A0A2K5VZH8_MACFA
MPAVKKEFPGREDLALALATFHPTLAALPLPPLPGYLAPLPAAAALPRPPLCPPRPPATRLCWPRRSAPRAYLSLHDAAPHLHLPRDPLALERFSATAAAAPDFQPLLDNGEPCIEVECGANRALLYVRKLCQGSKGPSIRHRGEWLTPNEFQFVSGRETAKDWKRSIRHKGKSLKTLMSKGILQVHPPICDCPGCRISSPVNRGRLADKRTVALPAARSLKKERTPSFSASDGDSDGSGPTCGRRPGLKQEDGPHIRIMKRRVHTHWDLNISFRETSCSQDGNLPTLISSIHRSRHLVMPEHQSRCEFQRGSLEIGLGPAGDLLGKRLGRSPHISSDCSSEKRARSESPQVEALLLPPELGPNMAPEDHYRRLVSALSEASTFEDPQRLYHLGLPSHGSCRSRPPCCRPRMPLTSPWAPISGPPSWGCPRLCARPQATASCPQPRRRCSPGSRSSCGSKTWPGAVGGLSVDGEEAPAPEDVSKWTVDDVCNFVGGLSGCGEYTRVFREQGIDGETLPLLTEEHLLSTMGLKLGPALKIRAQVARRLGRVFYMASFPVALPLQPPILRAPERELGTGEQPLSPKTATSPYGGGHTLAGRASPKQENGTLALLPGAPDPSQPLC